MGGCTGITAGSSATSCRWDGVGFGSDGTLWGGEALTGGPGRWKRRASFRKFSLVGGDKAGREPWRSAAALMWAESRAWPAPTAASDVSALEFVGAGHARDKSVSSKSPVRAGLAGDPFALAKQAWQNATNTHETSAAGRLFDAAAALILNRTHASFEGQGPMELEHIAADGCEAISLPLSPDEKGILRSNWAPLLDPLSNQDVSVASRAGIFHETMAQALVDQALAIRETTDFDAIGLSGGVFQNRRLTETVSAKLKQLGLTVRLHQDIPANDGGLCFGQIIEALAIMRNA
jgi:hydrogenase maturation protein HypF